jgi:RNA polymerase sigma-70 factor (ECF subfamily)
MRPDEDADAALLVRLRAGDEGAFRELVEKYHGSMVRLARAFVASEAVAEEVVQESWMGIIKGLPKFEGRAKLKSWMLRIVTNQAKRKGVKEKRSLPFSSVGGDDEDGSALNPDRFSAEGHWIDPPSALRTRTPEGAALDKEVRRVVEEAIEKLPDREKIVITMRDIELLDSDDVCEALEITKVHQRVLLHRGRTRIRAALERELGIQR